MAPSSPKTRFAALHYRDFRLFWIGQLFSTIGRRIQAAVILWQIYELTGEPLALGAIGLVNVIPVIIVSLISGVLADVLDRRKLMLLAQGGLAALSLLLGWLTFQGLASVWPIYAISLFSALSWTFETPARQALIPNLLSREHLANAYSLNSSTFQMGNIIGPALAGFAIAEFGMGVAYGLSAIAFLVVVVTLWLIRGGARESRERPEVSLAAVKEGVQFVLSHPLIRPIMLLDFMATFFSSATVLLPIFAQDILKVGPQGYGWLYAAVSIGAMAMAGLMSLQTDLPRQGLTLLAAVALYGAATILFGLSRSFALSFFALALTGGADTLGTIIRQTVRNLQTPDHLRGRMTSLNMIFYRGGPELGELEAGLAASLLGAPLAVVTGGLACLVGLGIVAWRSPVLRSFNGNEAKPTPTPAR